MFIGLAGIAETLLLIEKYGHDRAGSQYRAICQEMLHAVRAIVTTIVPLLLLTYGGGSFALETLLHRQDNSCTSIRELVAMDSRTLSFQCANGYVATELQANVTSWHSAAPAMNPFAARRLRMMHHAAHHMMHHSIHHGGSGTVGGRPASPGFAAPVFESYEHYQNAGMPVAWAVSAGGPVRHAQCSSSALAGVCGFFASRLRSVWNNTVAPPHFGSQWGFNITRFDEPEMHQAANLSLQKLYDSRGIIETVTMDTVTALPFIIAEDSWSYCGSGWTMLFFSAALLGLGLMDRCIMICDLDLCPKRDGLGSRHRDLVVMPEDARNSSNPPYAPMPFLGDEVLEVDPHRSTWQEIRDSWNNFNSPAEQRAAVEGHDSWGGTQSVLSTLKNPPPGGVFTGTVLHSGRQGSPGERAV